MTSAEGAVKSMSAVDAPTLCSGDTDWEHIVGPRGVARPQPGCHHPPYEGPLRTQFLLACTNPGSAPYLLEVGGLARGGWVLLAVPPSSKSSVTKRVCEYHEGVCGGGSIQLAQSCLQQKPRRQTVQAGLLCRYPDLSFL